MRMASLTRRCFKSEWMDDPALDAHRHLAALRGLERINAWSGTVGVLWRAIEPELRSRRDEGLPPLRLLDVATGSGDVPCWLAATARRQGLALEVLACDFSHRAIDIARRQRSRSPDVRFFVADAMHHPLPRVDVITACLFLHHVPTPSIVPLLRRLAERSDRLLVDDLRRTRLGFILAWAGTRLLSRSPVVHEDGPRSVRNALTIAEMRAFAAEAGLAGATVVSHWPQRFLLDWRRS